MLPHVCHQPKRITTGRATNLHDARALRVGARPAGGQVVLRNGEEIGRDEATVLLERDEVAHARLLQRLDGNAVAPQRVSYEKAWSVRRGQGGLDLAEESTDSRAGCLVGREKVGLKAQRDGEAAQAQALAQYPRQHAIGMRLVDDVAQLGLIGSQLAKVLRNALVDDVHSTQR